MTVSNEKARAAFQRELDAARDGATHPLVPREFPGPVTLNKAVTIDGVIEAGVEPGCTVLTAGNTSYLILAGSDVPMGVPVRVEGTLQPGVLSTCQQGTPLRVTSVKRR